MRAALLLLLFATPTVAEESRVIQIRVDGKARFDVIYHRARSTNIGVAIGGLIGAAIDSGIEHDRDASKRLELRPFVPERIWEDAFIKTLDESLRAKGFDPLWVEDKSDAGDAKADVHLVLLPDTYGFRLVEWEAKLMSAYVEFDAMYGPEPIRRRKRLPEELFYVTDKKQMTYEELAGRTVALSEDLESVLRQAARRLANRIVYNPGSRREPK
jgi:hypothetical protein